MEISSERIRKACRDGYLDILRNATRRECNYPDDDGMTATHWASYCGNLNALRIIVGRGGDPEKCDNFGYTSIHWAAQNGHIKCVSFLISFGVNLWAMDNDYHTAKDIAALNNRDQIVQLIDYVIAQQSALNPKTVMKLKDKSRQDTEKRIKNFRKLQQKSIRQAEKDEQQMRKKCNKNLFKKKNLCVVNTTIDGCTTIIDQRIDDHNDLHFLTNNLTNSHQLVNNINDKRNSDNYVPKFSDLVNNNAAGTMKSTSSLSSGAKMKILSRKALMTKKLINNNDTIISNSTNSSDITTNSTCRSIKSMMIGIRRDDHIVYVPKFNSLSVNDLLASTKVDENNQQDNDSHSNNNNNNDMASSRLSLKNIFTNADMNNQENSEFHDTSSKRTSFITNTLNCKNIKTTLKSKLFRMNHHNKLAKNQSFFSKSNMIRTRSEPDFSHIETDDDDKHLIDLNQISSTTNGGGSIFERPGFGSVAFRGKFTPELLFSKPFANDNDDDDNNSNDSGQDHDDDNDDDDFNDQNNDHINHSSSIINYQTTIATERDNSYTSDSIGSAGSLLLHNSYADDYFEHSSNGDDHHHQTIVIIDDDDDHHHTNKDSLSNDHDNQKLPNSIETSKTVSVLLFLYANNLNNLYEIFERNQIDIDQLMLMNDNDFINLNIPYAFRLKLMNAIEHRRKILSFNNYHHDQNDPINQFNVFETRL